MDKPKTSELLRSFLIWFCVFYLVFWGYQTFMQAPPEDGQEIAGGTEIELSLFPKKVAIGNPTTLNIANNQLVAWDYADICADGRRPIITRKLNGQSFALEYSQTDCQKNFSESGRLSVPAGETVGLHFGALNAALFNEAGNYEISLPASVLGQETATAVDLTVKEPGFFRNIFRHGVINPLFNLLTFLVERVPGHSLGWAIVAMTLLVRMVLIVPNQKAMKSQRKLQKLQPEIQSLKKKHGKDQQALAMATMGLYKKHKINPMSSCWPILLQMPFLLGIYFVVRDGLSSEFAHRLYNFQSNFDLGVVNNDFFGLDLSIVPPIWTLPIIVAIAQFVAMKLALIINKPKADQITKKKSKKGKNEPDMAEQMQQMQKMMIWIFPVMIGFFTATFPAGVGIYWLTSTVFGIAQQKFVNWQLDRPQVKRKEA